MDVARVVKCVYRATISCYSGIAKDFTSGVGEVKRNVQACPCTFQRKENSFLRTVLSYNLKNYYEEGGAYPRRALIHKIKDKAVLTRGRMLYRRNSVLVI